MGRWALWIAGLDTPGVASHTEKAVEIGEAVSDCGRDHRIELAAKQPHSIRREVRGIVDLAGPIGGVDQSPGRFRRRGLGA